MPRSTSSSREPALTFSRTFCKIPRDETSTTMLATMQNLANSPPQAKLGCALMAVGAAKATEHLVGLVRGAWKHFLRPRRWLLSRYACPDVEPWVVISGKLG